MVSHPGQPALSDALYLRPRLMATSTRHFGAGFLIHQTSPDEVVTPDATLSEPSH